MNDFQALIIGIGVGIVIGFLLYPFAINQLKKFMKRFEGDKKR